MALFIGNFRSTSSQRGVLPVLSISGNQIMRSWKIFLKGDKIPGWTRTLFVSSRRLTRMLASLGRGAKVGWGWAGEWADTEEEKKRRRI
jgi:hypothetical protein